MPRRFRLWLEEAVQALTSLGGAWCQPASQALRLLHSLLHSQPIRLNCQPVVRRSLTYRVKPGVISARGSLETARVPQCIHCTTKAMSVETRLFSTFFFTVSLLVILLQRLELRRIPRQNENPADGRGLVLLPQADPPLSAHSDNVLEASEGMCWKTWKSWKLKD